MFKTIMHIVGARPNFVKAAPVIRHVDPSIKQVLIHTGQHYDSKMSDVFFDNLKIPRPTESLNIGSGTHAVQTGRVMIEIENCLKRYKPELVLVYGDVNSTLGAAISAVKMNIKLAHVESGLRSFDRNMPEEINRMIVDRIADYHFVTEQGGFNNLLAEGHEPEGIFFVGNTMIDSVYEMLKHVPDFGLKDYMLITLHRPSNVDTEEGLNKIIDICSSVKMRKVFPMHPRTKKNLLKFELYDKIAAIDNLEIMEPVGYFKFGSLMLNSKVVLTDSGGIQEETTALGVPCLTLRRNTERWSTVLEGTNTLVDSVNDVLQGIKDLPNVEARKPPLWDGQAGNRIAEIINRGFK